MIPNAARIRIQLRLISFKPVPSGTVAPTRDTLSGSVGLSCPQFSGQGSLIVQRMRLTKKAERLLNGANPTIGGSAIDLSKVVIIQAIFRLLR
jgi:hypothetical protein